MGVSRGSSYFESHKGSQLHWGKLFGSKNASHPHFSPPSTMTHPCLVLFKEQPGPPTWLSFCATVTVWTSVSWPALAARWGKFVSISGTKIRISNHRGSQYGVVQAHLIELFVQVCKSSSYLLRPVKSVKRCVSCGESFFHWTMFAMY